jgi:hypothetical protein
VVRALTSGADPYLVEAQSDPNGAYALAAVPLGEAKLAVRRIAGGAEVMVPIVVEEGENRIDVELDGVSVTGRAVDLEGAGVPGVELMLSKPHLGAQAYSGTDGGFSIADLEPGRYFVFATKQGWAARVPPGIDVGPAGLDGLEVVMTRGTKIRGRILGVAARELADVSVMAFGQSNASARVLADGTYEVNEVVPGEWTVAGYAGNHRQVRHTITVPADQSVTTLDLDFSGPGFVLRGHLTGPTGPLQDSRITLRSNDESRNAAPKLGWTDYQGGFRFGPLPPGTYVLEAYAGAWSGHPIVMRVLTIEDDLEVFLTAADSTAP